jgi:P27 family predicted phage terminase small subunit
MAKKAEYAPPVHLSERSQALWRDVVPRRCDHPEQLTLLTIALESLDQADECQTVLRRDGMTVKTLTTGTVHKHPLVDVAARARSDFQRAWAALNLTWVPSHERLPQKQSGLDRALRDISSQPS